MKREYLNEVFGLLDKVSDIKWTDADEGQLDYYTQERPPVGFPCCLVELSMPDTKILSSMSPVQRSQLRLTLTIAFHDCATLNTKAPKMVRETAMKRYDILEKIKAAVNGQWFEGFQQPWLRRSCIPVKREDGLKVFEMIFEAAVID